MGRDTAYSRDQRGRGLPCIRTSSSNNLTETTIIVDAFDWYGNKTTEERTIKMDRQAPSVNIKSDRSWVYPENEAHLTVTSSDNDEIAKLVLTCNGEEVPPQRRIPTHSQISSPVSMYLRLQQQIRQEIHPHISTQLLYVLIQECRMSA